MKDRNDSQQRRSFLARLRLAGIVLLLSAASAFAQNASVSFDFQVPGSFNNLTTNVFNPTNNVGPDFLQTFFPNGIGERPGFWEAEEGGVGSLRGSRALDIRAGGNDTHFILLPLTFDFSAAGTTLEASALLKFRKTPAATANNARALQLGFVTSTNLGGINANAGQGFMSVILQSITTPSTYQLRYQTKPTLGTTATEVTLTNAETTFAGVAATSGGSTWYRLTARFINVSATTFNVAATLEDMGFDGLNPISTVATLASPTPVTLADLAGNNKLYFVVRVANQDAGVDFLDNIKVGTGETGSLAVQPLPATTTVAHGDNATLFAKATGPGFYRYQWNKNGSPITGATQWRYNVPPVTTADNGTTFTVSVSDGTNSVTSTATTLAVTARPLAVASVGSINGGSVGVRFNQPVDKATAETAANYAINGTAPKSAVLYTASTSVGVASVILIPQATLTGPYTVTVQNVKDISGVAIASGASANGRVEGFSGMDMNVAAPAGWEYSFAPGQFEVVGGGVDIWNASDQFRFVYKQRSGDFDVSVKVPYLDPIRSTAKGGLTVRSSLDPAGIQVGTVVDPNFPARNFTEGTVRQNYNTASASWGSNTSLATNANRFPNVYIRLRRTGNIFTRYWSNNGSTWIQEGQVAVPLMPDDVYFGLGVASAAQGELLRALFENYTELTPAASTITIITNVVASVNVNAGAAPAGVRVSATWSGTTATATNEVQAIWQRDNGSGVFTNLTAANATYTYDTTNSSYTFTLNNTGNLFTPDNGARYRAVLRAPGAPDVISDVTTVTVVDTALPTATAAIPANSLYNIQVTFNEPVSSSSALNLGNYTINTVPATTPLLLTGAQFADTAQRIVTLTVSTPLQAGDYTVAISGIQDLNNNAIASVTRTVNQPATPPQQSAVIEMINNIGDGSITGMNNYQNSAKFINRLPDNIFYNNVFGYQINLPDNGANGFNNYGARVFSYFVPATTGNYKFYVASDDSSILLMNTNSDPTASTDPFGVVELGRLTAFTGTYTLMTAASTNIALVAGQKYYLECRWKEGGGGDGVRVAARLSTDNTAPPATEAIPASQLAFPGDVALKTPIVSEYYTGLDGNNNLAAVDAMASSAAFIARTPNQVSFQPAFALNRDLSDTTKNNYGGRVFSYFRPDHDGLYRIWWRSDDGSRVLMNTNSTDSKNPAGAVILGGQDVWNINYISSAQNVPLKAGQDYYIEGRFREGGGGDGFTLTIHDQDNSATPTGGSDATLVEVQPGDLFNFPYELFTAIGPVTVANIAPANPTVAAGQRVTFSIPTPGGATPITVTWLKNGKIIYANANSYTTQPLTAADSGAVYSVMVQNQFATVIKSTTVTVTPDNSAPSFLAATGSHLDRVRLDFSEALDRATAINPANYTLSGGLAVKQVVLNESTRQTVLLITTKETEGQSYSVTVSGLKDTSGNPMAASVTRNFSAWSYGGSGLYTEVFSDGGGTAIFANGFTSPTYMVNGPAAFTGYIPNAWFGTETQPQNNFTGATRNNILARLTGLFRPPEDGYYRFLIRGDDETRLFMNTNGPAYEGKVYLARNLGAGSGTYWNGTGDTQTGANSFTPLLQLRKDTEYYFEAYYKEGGGGDYVEVALHQIFDPDNDDPRDLNYQNNYAAQFPINNATVVVPGAYFRPPANPDLAVNMSFIVTPPATVTLGENELLTLSAILTNQPALFAPATTYQWQKFNGSDFVNIDFATSPTYSTYANTGTAGQYRLIVRMPTGDRVFNTTVTVNPDVTNPSVLSVTATNRMDRLYVKYSEPVAFSSASLTSSYTVAGATVSAVDVVDSTTVVLRTSDLTPDTTYQVTIRNITDNAGHVVASQDLPVKTWHFSPGFWSLEYFNNAGASVDVNNFVTTNAKYLANTPDEVRIINGRFSTFVFDPAGSLRDQYGARMMALFRPPSDGDYRFFVRVDDQVILYISDDEKPDTLRQIAADTLNCCTGFLEPDALTGQSTETSAAIPLLASKRYLLVAVMRENGGGDWAEVAFRKEGDPTAAGSLSAIPAQYLGIYGDPATPLSITQNPTPVNPSILENRSVTFTARGTSTFTVGYQWLRNGVPIPNATGPSYTTPLLPFGDSGVQYSVIVSGFGNALTSSVSTVTISRDLAGPLLAEARSFTSSNTVRVRFNEPIQVTATTLLSDDFGGGAVDTSKWVENRTPFETTGNADTTITEAGGVVTFLSTNTSSFWGGATLKTVSSFNASASQNLRFGVDRVAITNVGTSARSAVRVSANATNFIVFAQNTGEGGWEYNRQSNVAGDNGSGNGADIATFDIAEDSALHRMEVVLDGSVARLYLDGVLGTTLPFAQSSNIQFEFGEYVRASNDVATVVFDNAKVERLEAKGTYTINNGATVSSVELTGRPDQVILRTSTLTPSTSYTLTVNGAVDLLGNAIAANSTIAIDQSQAIPVEVGTTVNGFQDDFTGTSRDARWVPRGPGGDVYNQAGGVLRVTTASGDPNHLLFEDNSYDKNNQEVLARIRVINAGTGDNVRGGVATSVESTSQGFDLHFRDEGNLGRHIEFLDDNRSWGPEYKFDWTEGTWYWMRFKSAPNTDPGQPDLFMKIWKADGTEPEPDDWQSTWDRANRTGFAGIAASSNNGQMEMEVDYFLLKAAGLPTTTVALSAFNPPPPDVRLSVTRAGNQLTVQWTPAGGQLFTAPTVTGPWTGTGDTDGSFTDTVPATGNKFYQVRP